MKAIGGFFEFELNSESNEYHKNLLTFNSARNALYFLLKNRAYKKIFLPYYICNSIIQTINKLDIEIKYYELSDDFLPLLSKFLREDEVLLYVNYFGIFSYQAKKLIKIYKNIIIDNSQAFFEKAYKNCDVIYSPRKFFGIADGAYLGTSLSLTNDYLPRERIADKSAHLLMRIEQNPKSYEEYLKNEKYFNDAVILRISLVSEKILNNIDYKKIKKIRRNNFFFLHKNLKKINKFNFKIQMHDVPMIYPLLIENGEGLRNYLISHKIYVAQYWKEVLSLSAKNSFESELAKNLVCLPIDQRYNCNDMKIIINNIMNFRNAK